MFRSLGNIMNMIVPQGMLEQDLKELVQFSINEFLQEFEAEISFIDYFKTYWAKKIDMWVRASRNVPHSSQDTNGAIEAYHGVLKHKFLGSSKLMIGRRVDWLIHKLTTACLPYYWYVQVLKDNGFVRNDAIEKVVQNSYQRALEIPDVNVMFDANESRSTIFVQSTSSSSILHTVYNADSSWACCTCAWAELGNICKHQIKVLLLKGISHKNMLRHCMDLYTGRVVDTHAIAPQHVQKQKEEMDSFLQDEGATCVDTSIVSSSSSRLPKDHIAHLESLCGDLLHLVGEDVHLINEACSQMKKTLGLVAALKARSEDAFDANNAFVAVDDGFGNTLKRAKPLIEKHFSKKRFKGEKMIANSFVARPKEKRLSMQSKLNEKAKKHE